MQTEFRRGFAPRVHTRLFGECVRSLAFATAILASLSFVQDASASSAEEAALPITKSNRFESQRAAELVDKAHRQGMVRVRVGLRVAGASPLLRGRSMQAAAEHEISSTKEAVLSRVSKRRDSAKVKDFGAAPFISVTVSADELERLLDDPDVEWVREPVTFSFNLELTRRLVRADATFNATHADGSGMVVAVIDSGVDDTHPMLAGKTITAAGACFSGHDQPANSLCPNGGTSEVGPGAGRPCTSSTHCWHGTHVASIAAGAGPLKGVARGAQIIPINVASRNGTNLNIDDDDLLAALQYVYSLRNTYPIASVNLSISMGLFTSACDTRFPDYAAIFDLLRAAGIAPVVAAGNSGISRAVGAPACLSNAVSVAASTKDDEIAWFSSLSKSVRLVAPGDEIHAALPGGSYGYASGTSMAAPHVAGAFAVLKQKFPSKSVEDLTVAFACSGKMLQRDRTDFAKPRIDLSGAVEALSGRAHWRFGRREKSDDWNALRGDWSAERDRYIGAAEEGTFVASMVSTCEAASSVRATVRLRGNGTAGIVISPNVDQVSNTLSGYWLRFSNRPGEGASIVKLRRVRLDRDGVGSMITACSNTTLTVPKRGFNAVEARITGTDIAFTLNGQIVCQTSMARASGQPRVMLAGQFDHPHPGNMLIVGGVRADSEPVSGSAGANMVASSPQQSFISVVKRPLQQATEMSSRSSELMYLL